MNSTATRSGRSAMYGASVELKKIRMRSRMDGFACYPTLCYTRSWHFQNTCSGTEEARRCFVINITVQLSLPREENSFAMLHKVKSGLTRERFKRK